MKIIYSLILILLINIFNIYSSNETFSEAFEEFFTTEDEVTPITESNQTQKKTLTDHAHNILESDVVNYNHAKIIALNKITAKSQEIILKLKDPVYFSNIEITLHQCKKKSDHYAPDNLLLLSITEHKQDEDSILLFQGWMFSSSIALSTFEHPIYEIIAKDCM